MVKTPLAECGDSNIDNVIPVSVLIVWHFNLEGRFDNRLFCVQRQTDLEEEILSHPTCSHIHGDTLSFEPDTKKVLAKM